MRPLRTSLFLLLFFAFRDPLVAQPGQWLTRGLVIDGELRIYRVHLPPAHAPGVQLPVVLGFHGGGGNAMSFASYGWSATADANSFVMVYPEGSGQVAGNILQTWNAGDCCGYAHEQGIDDVAFIDRLIDAVHLEFEVDLNRVYATGMSNGGMMSYRLGVDLGNRLAAIAPVAAALQRLQLPDRPIPLLAIHGALDANVPWQGGVGIGVSGVSFTSQEDSIAPFAQVNGTGPFPQQLAQVIGQAQLYTSEAPVTGAPIHYWWLLDQAHTWPGTPSLVNPAQPFNSDIAANQLIWDFFAAHPRERLVEVTSAGCALGGEPVPQLRATPPTLGETLEFSVAESPGIPGQIWIAQPPAASWTFPGGCAIGLDPASAFALFDVAPGPNATLLVPVPAEPALHRMRVALQAFWVSPLGLRASNALELQFGW